MNYNNFEEVPIIISNHKELLNLLAQGYGSLSRILMEYIDNSFDSADDTFNEDLQKYSSDISIIINIDRNENKISITDNCTGMNKDLLKRLANKINDSVKKNKKGSWVNGQFGLGAHAFRLFAEDMIVTSKMATDQQYIIHINKNKECAQLYDDAPQIIINNGTTVELLGIEKLQMKNLPMSELENDIEIHFEMLLRRNVSILIRDGINEVKCEPTNYDDIEGIPIKKIVKSWQVGSTIISTPKDKAIEVNLKITHKTINRPVYFSGKGRKISNVSELKSFKEFINTNNKKRYVWSHPLVTGYIEIKSNLKPKIHRDDFETQKGERTAIYTEVVKFEDEISEAIQKEMQNKTDEGMKNFSSALTDILTELAKEDSLNLHKLNEANNELNKDGETTQFEPAKDGSSTYDIPGGSEGVDGDKTPIDDPGGGGSHNVPGDQDSNGSSTGTPTKPKKSGIKIEFMNMNAVDDNYEQRVHYGDGIIYIFKDHPDFKSRVHHTRGGELAQDKVTPRLANYLAAIISSKYKEQFYQQKKLEPERDKILDEQIDFIFRFENLMQGFIDQTLDKIGEIK